jgi:hypothetical protein
MADDRAEDARSPDEEAHARALAAERIVTALLVRLVHRGTLAGADAAAVLADASDGLTSDAMSGRVPKRSATLATDRVRMLEALLGPADAATPGPITGPRSIPPSWIATGTSPAAGRTEAAPRAHRLLAGTSGAILPPYRLPACARAAAPWRWDSTGRFRK